MFQTYRKGPKAGHVDSEELGRLSVELLSLASQFPSGLFWLTNYLTSTA